MAAGLSSFGPGLVTKGHHRKNGIWLEARNQLVFVYQQDAKSASRFSGGDLSVTKGVPSRGLWFERCFWSIVLLPMRRHSSFLSSYWYNSNRKKEIYNIILVPGRQISKGGCLFSELLPWNVFAKVWLIWDFVLSPVRRHGGFMS